MLSTINLSARTPERIFGALRIPHPHFSISYLQWNFYFYLYNRVTVFVLRYIFVFGVNMQCGWWSSSSLSSWHCNVSFVIIFIGLWSFVNNLCQNSQILPLSSAGSSMKEWKVLIFLEFCIFQTVFWACCVFLRIVISAHVTIDL